MIYGFEVLESYFLVKVNCKRRNVDHPREGASRDCASN